jgi:iron complex outermembrane receptor protein
VTTYVPPFARASTIDAPLTGGNVLARWNGALRDGSSVQLQSFFARTTRDELPVQETRDTFDVDFQHTPSRWGQHQVRWGLGYRVTRGHATAVAPTEFFPPDRADSLTSVFIQDELGLIPDRVRLTLGSKFEHNAYSGFEFQPGARLLWTPDEIQAAWAALTRAVRTPSRVETDYTTNGLLNPAIPQFLRLIPNPEFKPESLVAYEAGYRVRPFSPVYLSLSSFYNQLDDVLSTEILTPFAEPASSPVRLIVPVLFGNGLAGSSHGVELSADVRVTPSWRWTAHYSYLRIQLSRQPGSLDGSQERRNEGLSPRHQLHVQSSVELPGEWSIDGRVRHVSALPAGPIPSYTTADVHVARQLTPRLELAIVGQDLAHARQVEWPSGSGANVGTQRSGYIKLTWRAPIAP